MGRYRKIFLSFFALIIIISLLSACTSKNDSGEDSSDGGFQNEMATEDIDYDSPKSESPEIAEGEKVIASYYTNMETLDFENTRKELDNLIKKYDSYIENSSIGFRGYEYSKNYRYGDFSIRIPKDNLEKFKLDLYDIGHLVDESTNKEDVSKYYRDTESRLKLVTAKEKRLLALLDKAVNIEDIIAIESELTNTIAEKEMLDRDLKSIDDRIDYTSLNLSITEVRSLSNIDKADSSLGARLKNAFRDSFYAFKLAVENLLVWLVYAIPYILILGILAIVVLIFIRKRRNS